MLILDKITGFIKYAKIFVKTCIIILRAFLKAYFYKWHYFISQYHTKYYNNSNLRKIK